MPVGSRVLAQGPAFCEADGLQSQSEISGWSEIRIKPRWFRARMFVRLQDGLLSAVLRYDIGNEMFVDKCLAILRAMLAGLRFAT